MLGLVAQVRKHLEHKQGAPEARWEETPAGLLSPRAGGLDSTHCSQLFFDDWPFSAELGTQQSSGAQGKDFILLAGAGGSAAVSERWEGLEAGLRPHAVAAGAEMGHSHSEDTRCPVSLR